MVWCVIDAEYYRFNHFVVASGRFTMGPIRNVQVGRDSIKKCPYRLLIMRESKIATTPRSY